MHPIPSILLLLLLCSTVTTSFPLNCTQTFSCGPLHNLSYPFTGGPQPAHCGPPEFHLTCTTNDTDAPILTTDSLRYRVIQINQTQNTLTLSRVDLYNNTCSPKLANTTLNSTVYTPTPDNENLTIFYGCSSPINSLKPLNLFYCDTNGNYSAAYYLIGPVPTDPALAVIRCEFRVQVPVLQTAADRLRNYTVLAEVLMEGFNVSYRNPYGDDCAMCLKFGGNCGFDEEFGGPVCICGDQICNIPGSSLWKRKLFVIAISLSVVGTMAALIVVICALRRKIFPYMMMMFKKNREPDQIEAFIKNYGALTLMRYSYADVKRMTNSFTDKLGRGGYGDVYKGKLPDGRLVATKVLSESKGNGEEFINEVASISRTSHVNVVTLVGFCYERTKRALIYEFMPNGSLDKFICDQDSSNTKPLLEWKTLYQIAVGIARGLEYLHRGCNTRILHFDIKPHNILLDENFCPKISDFGLAKLCKREESIVSMLGARGTIGYIAPEVFCRNFGGVSHKSDVYSYGMMVLEMVGGRKNFDDRVSKTSEKYFPDWIYKQLEPGEDFKLQGVTTDEEVEIARKMIIVSMCCIQTNPLDRPSMTKVVEMLEGHLQSLQIPPKPFLSSPPRLAQPSSMTSSSSNESATLME